MNLPYSEKQTQLNGLQFHLVSSPMSSKARIPPPEQAKVFNKRKQKGDLVVNDTYYLVLFF